jgi:redox-sensitive bicupin YhaK (pirin superfamily)
MTMSDLSHIKPLGFNWEMYNPFIFCAHHDDHFPEGNGELGPSPDLLKGRNLGNDFAIKDGWRMYHGTSVPGFPVHPHRGFETVTIVLEGMVDHSDSMGAAGRYGGGDVQWMTAGAGMQHSEMFPMINETSDNKLDLFQVWLNLPAKNKFVDPYYKMLWSEEIPVIEQKDNEGRITRTRLIAGQMNGTSPPDPTPDSWAADPENEVRIWLVDMEPNAETLLPDCSAQVTRALYFYQGSHLEINGTTLPNYHQGRVSNKVLRLKNGDMEGKFLLLQARPIDEPIVQYGPFVMNSREEIQQAFDDYRKTEFGGWPWERRDMVHGSNGRFARYADGTEVIR